MLLSTGAGGIGLTLTGADRVVIYDPSWNPAEDSQAVDRCYRIGQKKPVIVFRLIAAGTVEEKMYEKQVHKDGIRRAVVTNIGSSLTRYFDKHDLKQIFKLNPEGQCDFLNRMGQRGRASGKESDLIHRGVIGISSHDVLYTEESIDPVSENRPLGQTELLDNPFGSSTKAAQADLTAYTPTESKSTGETTKVLWKSQPGLLKGTCVNELDGTSSQILSDRTNSMKKDQHDCVNEEPTP